MVNPTSLLFGGRPTARDAHEMRGNGMLEKANAVKYSWPLNPLWSGAEWNSRIFRYPNCGLLPRIRRMSAEAFRNSFVELSDPPAATRATCSSASLPPHIPDYEL